MSRTYDVIFQSPEGMYRLGQNVTYEEARRIAENCFKGSKTACWSNNHDTINSLE